MARSRWYQGRIGTVGIIVHVTLLLAFNIIQQYGWNETKHRGLILRSKTANYEMDHVVVSRFSPSSHVLYNRINSLPIHTYIISNFKRNMKELQNRVNEWITNTIIRLAWFTSYDVCRLIATDNSKIAHLNKVEYLSPSIQVMEPPILQLYIVYKTIFPMVFDNTLLVSVV